MRVRAAQTHASRWQSLAPQHGDHLERKVAWGIGFGATALALLLLVSRLHSGGAIGSYGNAAPTPRINNETMSLFLLAIGILAFFAYSCAHPRDFWQTRSRVNILLRCVIAVVCLGLAVVLLAWAFFAAFWVL
jgi:hypothetical protein